jgi:hypothetical protein
MEWVKYQGKRLCVSSPDVPKDYHFDNGRFIHWSCFYITVALCESVFLQIPAQFFHFIVEN